MLAIQKFAIGVWLIALGGVPAERAASRLKTELAQTRGALAITQSDLKAAKASIDQLHDEQDALKYSLQKCLEDKRR